MRAIADEVLPDGAGLPRHVLRRIGAVLRSSGNALAFAYAARRWSSCSSSWRRQFESFLHPITILVAVALSFTGALVALELTGDSLNLFSQIGLVMLVGLVTKNSILIVEFANQLRAEGKDLAERDHRGVADALPADPHDRGVHHRRHPPDRARTAARGKPRAPLGIAVVGGMFFSTLLTFYVVPAAYVALDRLRRRRASAATQPVAAEVATSGGR